ncbi:phosphotransferase [Kribbella sp. NPDC051620]|uniref:phosphotransferase n=1 Tax=Kribbella sp. NPDC051620 TaxID=3364120 RepID=UPI00379FBD19
MTQTAEESRRIATAVAGRRGARNVRQAGIGTEFVFFVADGVDGPEGYRVPRSAMFRTANNAGVAAARLQEQERSLMVWAAEQGVPSVRVQDLIEVEGSPVLVVDVVPDDGSALDGRSFGRIIGLLHRAPVPRLAPVAQQGRAIAERIARRLTERHAALSRYGLAALPGEPRLAELVRAGSGPEVVTHLDLRRQNVRCRRGEVTALFDWSNALLAPAALELARLTEYAEIADNGLPLDDVLAGYREAGGQVANDTEAWTVLRLDTSVMLANVFDSVAPDQPLRDLFLDRSDQLARSIS